MYVERTGLYHFAIFAIVNKKLIINDHRNAYFVRPTAKLHDSWTVVSCYALAFGGKPNKFALIQRSLVIIFSLTIVKNGTRFFLFRSAHKCCHKNYRTPCIWYMDKFSRINRSSCRLNHLNHFNIISVVV